MKKDDSDALDQVRSAADIAIRSIIISSVVTCAYDNTQKNAVVNWLKKESLWKFVSPDEKKFLSNSKEDEKACIRFSWKLETLVPLMWSIGKIKKLQPLDRKCDTDEMQKAMIFSPSSTAAYVTTAKLMPEKKILSEYEKVYQAHWKIKDAGLHDKKVPKNLDPGVVYERHYAFNWLIGYRGQEWDDITTDT